VLVALRAFLADSERRAPEAERAQRHRLATGLMAAMVAEPPVRPDRRRRLHELCVSLHPSAARAAGTERLLDAAYAPAPRATPRAEWAPWFDGKDLTDDRLSPHLPRWYAVLGPRRDEPLEILELGSGEGRTAVFLLHFFHHARLTCLEPSARLRANVAEFGDRVGFDVDEEARFDLVVVGADRPLEPGWSRLGPGGVLVLDAHDPTLDDDRTPRPEVEAFLARHAGEYRELARGHQVFVERLSPR